METNTLNVKSPSVGGYISSEQIDFLTIIQCNSKEELIEFIKNCDQINQIDNIVDEANSLEDLESAKRFVFKAYQDTMVYHEQSKEESRLRRFEYLGVTPEEMKNIIIQKSQDTGKLEASGINSDLDIDKILELNHHFISEERDQNKSTDLYDELVTLNNALGNFSTVLVGSGKIYNVVNKNSLNKRYDFYHAKRDLDFAYRNGKQVRYHSLLVKDDASKLFEKKSKEEILDIIREYVKASIDFINEYNSTHKININGKEEPVIKEVDLFNEMVSFREDINGNYYNIWKSRYDISMTELMSAFEYALEHKPEGVSYLYNEPLLENDKRRKKVLDVLEEIDTLMPGLIDTLGSQMHINVTIDDSKIDRCFNDFKNLQEEKGKKIQITEFDMSLSESDAQKVFGETPQATLDHVYSLKKEHINSISNIISNSGVVLSGVSYWSLTDGIDCNLERLRGEVLRGEIAGINDPNVIITACGGLIPTHKKLIKKYELYQEVNNSEQSNTKSGMHM